MAGILVSGATLASLFVLTPQAHAGLFSFVSGLFAGEEKKSSDSLHNSQTMALLQASLNPNVNASSGGGEVIIVGGTALLPESGPIGGDVVRESRLGSDQISIYVVREGDSLSQIAKMFGVSVNTIRWSNDIKNSTIREGQTLVILPVSGVRHTVVSGDTLQSIAKKYGGSVEEITRYNDFSAEKTLAVGEVVIIPDGEISTPAPAASTRVARSSSSVSYPSHDGFYLRPVEGATRTQGLHGYNAVDLAASAGASILASASGEVIISRNSGWNGGYGRYIVVAHNNGTQTLYAHNSENIVAVGQRVVQGQVIGYVGSTGKSTGPHVHFEVRGAKNPF